MKILFNWLIPDRLKKDALTYSYAKNLVGSVFIAVAAIPTYALIYYFWGLQMQASIILICGAVIISSILLLKYTGYLLLVREIITVFLFICISWLSYRSGGLYSPATFWLILPPLLAIFFGGIKDGIFWSLAGVSIVVLFFYLEYSGIPLPTQTIIYPLRLQAISLCGLILIILWLVYFFERGKREAANEVQSANIRLRLAKEEAEASAKKAEIANHLKTEFLANMSHELRTPLNAIIGFTELIYSGKAGPISREQNEYLGDVLTSAKHLLQLINDILDLTQIESGKIIFRPEPVDLLVICNEVKEILGTMIKSKHIEFILDIDPSLRNIIIDPRKLKQTIYNYLSNAIKFTPVSGQIQVRISPFAIDQFKLEVTDNGIGISEEDLKKLFVEFQQLDSGFSKKFQGTGLGLALTQRIVEAQGGYVGVESRLGKGSTFFAILPCSPRENF